MVDRALWSQIGAGRGKHLRILIFLFLLFTGSNAHAGFNWVSDWSVTTVNVNIPPAFLTPPNPSYPDFIVISGSSSYVSNDPQQTYTTASYAERQFQLAGFNEPVRVTIQTVLEGNVNFNQWGLRAGLNSNNGIGNDIQTIQRFQLLPGSNRIRITQTRDVYVGNGTHTISASIDPLITPNYTISSSLANAYVEGTLQIGVYAINGMLLVPEPSSWVAASTGILALLVMRNRRKLCGHLEPNSVSTNPGSGPPGMTSRSPGNN
jgi:hypothetical protein